MPGIVVWGVLQVAASKFCTGWREERVKYGFVALGGLAWWLPNLAIGETGASEVEQLVARRLPAAAFYLAYLLIGEWIERRNLAEWKARADSEKLTVGFRGRE
jgi:hypothetical protein